MNKLRSLFGSGVLLGLLLSPLAQAAQTCNSSITPTTPSSHFTLNGDTVTHNPTQLIWLRCSLGQNWNGATCTGPADTYTWQQALQAANAANAANLGDYSDWRLPNIKELRSIVEYACYSPSINEAIFPVTPASYFWSSSPLANHSYDAWGIYFNDGDDNVNKSYAGYVRLVRGGQAFDSFDAQNGGVANQPPNGVINTPSSNVTITQGQSVNFTGTGTDPDNNTPLTYLWNFGAGSGLADSTAQNPGNQVFNNVGVFTVSLTVTDSKGLADPTPATVQVTVSSITPPDIIVNPTTGLSTTEAGDTAAFTVAITSQPTADVTIALSSSDTTEGTVNPTTLTFTAANFATAQTVTVTGVDDATDDGDMGYSIITAAATSADANYDGVNAEDVAVVNMDDDATGSLCNLDIDDNGQADALTDGLLAIRYLFGFGGDGLINGAVAANGQRTTAAAIEEYFGLCANSFDIDGNGNLDALTDGLLIIRHLFGFTGNSLINGAIGDNATRTTAPEISDYIDSLIPISQNSRVENHFERSAWNRPAPLQDEAQQVLELLPAVHYAKTGDQITLEVEYTTNTGEPNLSGLGLNIYYDSHRLDCENGFANAMPDDLIGIGLRQEDKDNADNNAETDSQLNIAWVSFDNRWPGIIPTKLFDLTCSVLDGLEDTTQIHVMSRTTASGYRLNPASVTVNRLP